MRRNGNVSRHIDLWRCFFRAWPPWEPDRPKQPDLAKQTIFLSANEISDLQTPTTSFQSFKLEKWTQTLELWTFQGHFELEISHESGIRDPHFKISRLESTRGDRRNRIDDIYIYIYIYTCVSTILYYIIVYYIILYTLYDSIWVDFICYFLDAASGPMLLSERST